MSVEDAKFVRRIEAYIAADAIQDERRTVAHSMGKSELDEIRMRVRAEHGDDVEAFLRAVFEAR